MASYPHSHHSTHNFRNPSLDTDIVSPLECSRDMEKIQRLWDETKEADRSKRRGEEQKQITRIAENECMELRSSLKYVESNLQRTRENYDIITAKYEKCQSELDRCYEQIARQASTNRQQSEQIKEMSMRINELTQMHHDYIMKNKVKVGNYQTEIDSRDQEIQRLKAKTQCQEEELGAIAQGEDQMRMKLQSLEEELISVKDENDSLRLKLTKTERQLNDVFLARRSEGSFQFEIQQLRADNRKLLQMLKSTKEYKEFAEYAQDSGGEVRTVKASKSSKRIINANKVSQQTRPVAPSSHGFLTHTGFIESEDDSLMDEWVPSEAHDLARKFWKEKNFSEDMVNMFVSEMNQIWRDREKRQLTRLKSRYSSEVNNLKRQLSQRIPFDEVTAHKQISRLKTDLRNAQSQLQRSHELLDKNKAQPPSIEFLDTTLKLTTAMEKERKGLQQENADLKKKLAILEKMGDNEEVVKLKFMEGAAWFADKAVSEADAHQARTREIVGQFEQRLKDVGVEASDAKGQTIYHSSAWLKESVVESADLMLQQLEQKRESAEYHVKTAQTKLDRLYS